MRVMLFIHYLGSALWIGGAVAAMVVSIHARNEDPRVRAGAFRLLAPVQTLVVAPGALLVVASGLLLTMRLMGSGMAQRMAEPGIWIMQGAGLVGGLLVLLVGLPAAVRMGGLAAADESGELPTGFDTYRRRQAVVSSVAGVLALISLFAAVVL